MASLAKKRKMNFSEREVEIIVEEIERHKHTLVNHFNAGVTHLAKNGAWLDILRKVNAVTTCPRELAEVKKKWSDMKTEVRRKVAQARAAIEGGGVGGEAAPGVPVILSAMQQRICNLLGEATIISLPADPTEGDPDPEDMVVGPGEITVTLTDALPTVTGTVCDEAKQLSDSAYMEDGGVVEYCTTTVGVATVEAPPSLEAPPTVDMLGGGATQGQAKPQELKSRIALNSARLLQEQRVTNVHVRQIAVHLEGQNELLAAMRRSQEAMAYAQERQAVALEGTQAALLALLQTLRPAVKELRRFLQGAGSEGANANANCMGATSLAAGCVSDGSNAAGCVSDGSNAAGCVSDSSNAAEASSTNEEQTGAKTPPTDHAPPQQEEEPR